MPITFVNAHIHTPTSIATTLRIAGDKIVALDEKPRRRDRVVDLDGAFVLPGLINAHDHLELNNFPRLKFRARYNNSTEWFDDFQERFDSDERLRNALAVPFNDRLWIGGMKQLLSGVTTVCHHNALYRPLRSWWPKRFPVRVVQRYAWAHSLYVGSGRAGVALRDSFRTDRPWIIHAAEGTDEQAAAEIPRLRELGLLQPNSVIVHGVAVRADERAQVPGLVWCPASNEFLFGVTASVQDFPCVALGSDSILSGSPDLLEELRCAQRYAGPEDLLRMVTQNPAQMLQLERVGRVDVGARADLVVLPALADLPAKVLLAATRSDLQLAIVGGAVRLAAAGFADLIRTPMRLSVDETEKFVPSWIHRRLKQLTMDTAFLGWSVH